MDYVVSEKSSRFSDWARRKRVRRSLLVVGAAGDLGQGIVRIASEQGWSVVAAGRDKAKLDTAFEGAAVQTVAGDIASEAGAASLWDAAAAAAGQIDAVVVTVSAANRIAPLTEWSSDAMADLLGANLLTHFNAAKVMLPRLPADGLFIGIGGGTADFVIPKMAPVSVAQAGLRMMYRGFARERKEGAAIRELMVVSMVNGASKRDRAQPEWVTDDEVGRHVCAILNSPEEFPGPILRLDRREQVGRADSALAKG